MDTGKRAPYLIHETGFYYETQDSIPKGKPFSPNASTWVNICPSKCLGCDERAKIFEESGFKAIGTTSAGIATSLGFKDGQHIPPEKMIEVIASIADAVNVPVSADIEAGYGGSAEDVAKTAKKVLEAGAVGINLEDSTGNPEHPLYDLSLQKEKIAAIKELSDTTEDSSLFINARTDTYWLNINDPSTRFQETVQRIKGFEKAGADCIFVPGLHDREIIQKLRKKTNGPINLLVDPEMPSLSELSNLGIERVSCGSGPFRATVTLLKAISEEIRNKQSFHHMTDDVLSYGKVADMVQQTPKSHQMKSHSYFDER